MRRSILIAALLCPLAAHAEARASDLDKAARLVFDQKYEAAVRALEVAWRQTGNKKDTVLRILELQGVVYAQLGQEPKAKAAFQMLLALDPKRELNGKYNAKVLRPFGEAQAWAVDNPPLEMSAEAAAVDGNGKVLQIAVKVKSDALKLARKVRFNVRPEGAKWSELDVDIQGAYASAGTDSDGVEWWAELLGEREMVLATVGSPRSPIGEGKLKGREPPPEKKPEVVKKPDEPPKKDVPEKKPTVDPDEKQPEMVVKPLESSGGSNTAIRAIGYAALAIGMAGLATGTVMGILWRSTKGTLDSATFDSSGTITSIGGRTDALQPYYAGLLDRARIQAVCANVLWGVGGGLAVAGIVLYLLGRDSADVSPGGGGLVVRW